MALTQKPMGAEELLLQPPIVGAVRVEDTMQQSLALLLGYAKNQRVLLKASPTGILYSTSPRLVDIEHWTATAPNQQKQGSDVPCTEVVCIAHPDNAAKVWVRPYKAATVNNAIPLDAGDATGFSIENLSELFALVVGDTETVIVGYSL